MEYIDEIISEGFCHMFRPFGFWNAWMMFTLGILITVLFTIVVVVGIIMLYKWLSSMDEKTQQRPVPYTYGYPR